MAGKTLQIIYAGDAKSVLAAQKQIDAGHGKLQGTTSKTGDLFKKTFGGLLPLSAAAGAIAVVGLAKTIIGAAADEGEALNKATVIFGKSADSVVRFSDTSATAFGISKAAALEAAGGFGAMFQTAGLAEQASSDMSLSMVKLAADMASFNNQDPSEMLERLRSGLAGEAEPLRQFGVFMSEARVKTEAYALGLADVGAELTEAQKVQARYSLILQDTTKQQGDFARTADSLPNLLRTLGAEMTDLAADIGQKLLPIAEDVVGLLRASIPLIQFTADNIELLVIGFAGFAAVKYVPGLLLGIAGGLEAIGFAAASGALLNLAAWLSGIGISATTAGAGVLYLVGSVDTASQSVSHFEGVTKGYTVASVKAQLASAKEGDTIHGLNQTVGDATRSIEAIRAKNYEYIRSAEGVAKANEAAAQATRDLRNEQLQLAGGFLGLIGAADQVQAAQAEINALQRKGKTGTEEYRDAVLSGLESQLSLNEGLKEYVADLKESGSTQQQVEGRVQKLAEQIRLQGGDVRDLIGDVRKYIETIYNVPTERHTSFTASFTPISQLEHQAAQHGFHGMVASPTLFLAGEAGIERVDITPGRGGGGGPVIVNVYVQVEGSVTAERDLAESIRQELIRTGVRNLSALGQYA